MGKKDECVTRWICEWWENGWMVRWMGGWMDGRRVGVCIDEWMEIVHQIFMCAYSEL